MKTYLSLRASEGLSRFLSGERVDDAAPPRLDTAACKAAIVELIGGDTRVVSSQFTEDVAVGPALLESSWKRISKRKLAGGSVREFDCTPYDGQLRAVVYDDGSQILQIEICGE